MQKVMNKFAGPEKYPYLCSVKMIHERNQITKNYNTNKKKYTTMIAIAFFATTILASIALRLGTMFMERR